MWKPPNRVDRDTAVILFCLVLAAGFATPPAAANSALDVDFYSCGESKKWQKTVTRDQRGRLWLSDQDGEVVFVQTDVPFTNDKCRAFVTLDLDSPTVDLLLDSATDLFISFEACKKKRGPCDFSEDLADSDLEKEMLALDHPINTVLDELKSRIDTADTSLGERIDAEEAARIAADEAEEAARIAADAAEQAARIAADAAEQAARIAADDAEREARLAADAALDAAKVNRIGDTMTGDLNLPRAVISECPAGLDTFQVAFEPNSDGNVNRLCASAVRTQSGPEHPTITFAELLESFAAPVCSALALSPFEEPAAFFGPIFAAILNQLGDLAEQALEVLIDAAEAAVNALGTLFNSAIGGLNQVMGSCTSDDPDDCSPSGSISHILCHIPGTDCDWNLQVGTVDEVELDADVEVPEVTSTDCEGGFDAQNIRCVLDPLWDSVGEEILGAVGAQIDCENPDHLEKIVEHIVHLAAFLPGLTDLAEATEFHQYSTAQNACAAEGAHVCTATEIFALLGDDGVDPPETPEGVLGYQGGEWVSDNHVTFDVASGSTFVFAVPWPPVSVDPAALFSPPPGLPISFGVARIPEGRFQCCMSSSVLP